MVFRRKCLTRTIAASLVCGSLFSGTAGLCSESQTVTPGDRARVHFTCRLKNGEVAASTYPSAAKDSNLPKAAIFVSRNADTPVEIIAGTSRQTAVPEQGRSLEGEIVGRLPEVIVGLPVGQHQTREITAVPTPEEKKGDYVLQIARVRQRAKEMRLATDQYKSRTGKTPEKGQPFTIDPAVPGKVSSVTESEVVVRFSAKVGDKVKTPFGEGAIREMPDRYEIVIDARKGALVRSGGLVGRITDVGDRFITVDYRHPFGGETLVCDVLVESAKPGSARE